MTDPHRDLDELASAVLDGEATATERDLVATDPALAARVERLRELRAKIAAVPPPDPGVREQAIAAALEAAPSRPDDGTTSLTVQRQVRRGSDRTLRIAGIAAAIAIGFLVVSVVALLATRDGDDASDDLASSPDEAMVEEGAEAPAAARDGAATADSVDGGALGEDGAASGGSAGDGALDGDADTAGGAAVRPAPEADEEAAEAAPPSDDSASDDGGEAADTVARALTIDLLRSVPDAGAVTLDELISHLVEAGDDAVDATTDEAAVCFDEIVGTVAVVTAGPVVGTVEGERVLAVGSGGASLVFELGSCTLVERR